jgi:minor extracellular protease Epr
LRTGRFPLNRLALLLALGVAFSPAAFAQLPGLGDGKILGGIGDAIDRSVDRAVDRAVTDPVTGRVDRTVEKLMQAKDLPKSLLDPLLDQPLLPARKDVGVEDGWRAFDHEWIALLTPEQLPALQAANVQIISRRTLASTGLVLVRVVVSDDDNSPARAEALLRSLGATVADRNHIYDERSGPAPDFEPLPAPSPAPQSGGDGITIGLIDTALARKHGALSRANIAERDFVESSSPRPTAHGTAIASLLVGREREHRGLLPDARLYTASVFYQGENGATGASTSALVAALDWMAAENVRVVNMSLAGPPNQVLGAMIDALSKRGVIIVAAVGNDGPSARPLYPAAFEPVIAVTAVDRRNKVYRWANQGPQVDFAAWGVATPVALPKGGYGEETGTSFAVPIVAAALAREVARTGNSASAAVKSLISRVEDLGDGGRDNTYGYGLVKPAS